MLSATRQVASMAVATTALRASVCHMSKRFVQQVPSASKPGNSDYDTDWNSLKRRLINLGTSPMCDVDRRLRVVSPKIQRINHRQGNVKFVGQARTVSCHEDLLPVVIALKEAKAGEVLIVDAQHSLRAVFGELFANEARRKGLAAVIIDGGVRDVDSIQKLDIPIYARFITPMAGGSYKITEEQTIVNCGNVHIAPGEIVVGDDDGIVVGSMEDYARIVPAAEALQTIETTILDRVQSGEPLHSMMNYERHLECIKNGTPSLLAYNKDLKM